MKIVKIVGKCLLLENGRSIPFSTPFFDMKHFVGLDLNDLRELTPEESDLTPKKLYLRNEAVKRLRRYFGVENVV